MTEHFEYQETPEPNLFLTNHAMSMSNASGAGRGGCAGTNGNTGGKYGPRNKV
jgi:hypothetical protein